MKKMIKVLAMAVAGVAIVAGFMACPTSTGTGSIESHAHTYSEDWTYDEDCHWHKATCEHTTEISDKAAHSWDVGRITKEATETEEGQKTYTCTVCSATKTENTGLKDHEHTFATELSHNEDTHYYAATCGHDVKKDEESHTFGEYASNNDATFQKDGTKSRTCSVCGYVETIADEGSKIEITVSAYSDGYVKLTGVAIKGTETWAPSSSVFVSGRSLTIPDLIVCDHEATRSEYKAVTGSDPSTASAYDADGNELTGDADLDNPVNYVSWYDAIVYCNTLSIKEGLTPCYTISSSTNPSDWGTVPTSSNSTWDAATCDFMANGYRLPTEAEWEWLARGGENYTYAGSNTVGDVAWHTSNTSGTRTVKTKQANGYGLYDMSGNVWEWCWDWYCDSISTETASAGAASDSYRCLRGGSWYYSGISCAVASRSYYYYPYLRSYCNGFRVVRNAN